MEVHKSEFLPDYQVYIAPFKSIGDLAIEWSVDIFDEDGIFVVNAGKVETNGDAIVYTGRDGWSQKFDSVDDARRALEFATFTMDKTKLN